MKDADGFRTHGRYEVLDSCDASELRIDILQEVIVKAGAVSDFT